jgi:predicted SprT family Zn-dependent metalloprotease
MASWTNPMDIHVLALELMAENGLRDWSFTIDRAKTRAGLCNYTTKTISISEHYMTNPKTTPNHIRDALLHEIAHALTPGSKHGVHWKRKALEIGCSGDRCCAHGVSAQKTYTVTCGCGKIHFERHKIHSKWMRSACKFCHEKLCIRSL